MSDKKMRYPYQKHIAVRCGRESGHLIVSVCTVYVSKKEGKISLSHGLRHFGRQIHPSQYKEPLKIAKRLYHPLKPWKDPESLFCDTEFLTEFIKKEPRKGKECK